MLPNNIALADRVISASRPAMMPAYNTPIAMTDAQAGAQPPGQP